jgi:c-di-GMP-binding flagellar brake protein YcgR
MKSIIDLVGDKVLIVDNPFDGPQAKTIQLGQDLTCRFYEVDAFYEFDTHLVSYEFKGRKSFLVLAKPENIQRIQRREYYRLKIALPLYFRPYSAVPARKPQLFRPVETKDVSGGGLLFVSEVILKKNAFLDLLLELPPENIEPIPTTPPNIILCIGQVIMVKKDNKESQAYHYSIHFTCIEPADRENIVRFVFDRQVKLRRI